MSFSLRSDKYIFEFADSTLPKTHITADLSAPQLGATQATHSSIQLSTSNSKEQHHSIASYSAASLSGDLKNPRNKLLLVRGSWTKN